MNNKSKLASILARIGLRCANSPERSAKVYNVTRRTLLAERAQIAGDGPNRRKGLLGRKGLATGEALWIVPCEAVHTFWMRFPIDLIYLDRKHRVVKTKSNVRPWRLSACLRAHSVIELAAGVILETQTRPGDRLSLESTRESVPG